MPGTLANHKRVKGLSFLAGDYMAHATADGAERGGYRAAKADPNKMGLGLLA